ncbi:hypothetical protein [Klebsiella pneumoniae]|uniref:hypothetical protein n=1 Tax=Klebsiella pneumoniae TaxID=573 RepID=UPI00358F6ABD
MKYLASFHTTLKVSRYLFRALAVLLWLLIAFVSVFYIVNALHEREAEIHQELNLNADQAQRYTSAWKSTSSSTAKLWLLPR